MFRCRASRGAHPKHLMEDRMTPLLPYLAGALWGASIAVFALAHYGMKRGCPFCDGVCHWWRVFK